MNTITNEFTFTQTIVAIGINGQIVPCQFHPDFDNAQLSATKLKEALNGLLSVVIIERVISSTLGYSDTILELV